MKTYFIQLGMGFILQSILGVAFADSSISQSSVPQDLWKSQAGMIEMAIILKTNAGKDKSSNEIEVFIKNISSSVKALTVSAKSDHGFSFFTVDRNGNEHLLHDRNPARADGSNPQEQLQEELGLAGSSRIDRIAPGETIMRATKVSPEELVLLEKYPVKCRFSIIDPQNSKNYPIESSPAILQSR